MIVSSSILPEGQPQGKFPLCMIHFFSGCMLTACGQKSTFYRGNISSRATFRMEPGHIFYTLVTVEFDFVVCYRLLAPSHRGAN
jgi:hypothetical protein